VSFAAAGFAAFVYALVACSFSDDGSTGQLLGSPNKMLPQLNDPK